MEASEGQPHSERSSLDAILDPSIGIAPEPMLKGVLIEATRALSHLDADRLEELALACERLNRDSRPLAARRVQAQSAEREWVLFRRLLEATGANLRVVRRARRAEAQPEGYRPASWAAGEAAHGND